MADRYVIVGGGAAGMAAAEQIRVLDPTGAITLVMMEREGYYSRPGLAYLLNGQVPEKQLFPLTRHELAALNIGPVFDEAIHIDTAGRTVALREHGPLRFDRLLLAPGAQAVMPKLEGVELEGVVTLDTLSDARRILKLARRARRAVVVGGGITALELAEGLAARGVETHYFLRRGRYWSGVLDEVESSLVEGRLEHEGIRIHRETELARVLGRRGRVHAVETAQGREIKCQIVAIAIGIRPRVALARQAGLEVDRGILVDERMQTSVRGIYAAGDAAQVFDPRSGRHVLDSLWWPAVEQGRTAGANMAGRAQRYSKAIAMNVTRIGGLTTTIIGSLGAEEEDHDLLSIARGDSEVWRKAPEAFAVAEDQEANRVRLLIADEAIIGALVMGNQRLSNPLQDLVLHRVDIQPIKDRLLHPKASLEDVLLPYWASWKRTQHAVES